MSKEENKAEGARKFRKNISETGRAVVASKFPAAVRPSAGLVNSWTSIIVEEEDGEEEIPYIKRDQTYLHASSGAFDWEVFLHEFLTLPTNAYWRAIVVISIVVNFFLVTFAYSFYKEILITSFHELTITDVIYAVDFTLALLHKYRRSLRRRMKVEFRSRFALIVDAISLLPLGLIYYIIYQEKADNNVLFVFKSVKILRFYRVYLYFDNITDSAGKNQRLLFSVKYLLYLSLLFHSLACLWFTLGCTSEKECQGKLTWTVMLETYTWKPDSVWDWYLISSYYSLCTIANTGFGEIHSTNTEERVLSMIAMLLGFYLTIGMFIGSLTSQVVNKERRQTMYVNQLHNIKKYLLSSKCDAVLSKRILTYYEVFWKKKNGVKEASNFDLLPLPLKMEICYDINCGLLDCSILLANLGEPFLRRLSLQMKNEFYLPGDVIYYQNVAKYTMIVIVSGVIEILSDEDDESPMVSFTSGTCLGEISTVLTCPAKATVRAATYTELQVIKKTDFFRLMIDYPLIHQKVRQNIGQRIDAAYKKKATADETQIAFSLMVSHSKEYRSIKSLKKALRMNQGLKSQRNQFDLDGDTSTTEMFTRDFLSLYNISEKVIERKGGMCWTNSFPCILQPNSAFLKVWMHVLFILVVYVGFVYPYCGGFIRTFPEWASSIGIIIDSVFFVDIVITCVTAIKHKNTVDVKLKEIVWLRMNTVGFYCDIISILPFEVYSFLEENPYKSERLWAVLKLNRLFKCWKISQYFKTLESNLWTNLTLLRTFKYVLYLILVSFWAGVALYMEACFDIECNEESWFAIQMDYEVQSKDLTPCTQYPYDMSVYFAVMTLSGVGFGDIYPQSKRDIIFTMFNIICGILFFGYCIAEFSATFTLSSRPRVEFQEAVIAIHKFMRDNNMSPDIVERVNQYFNLQWMHNEGIIIRQKRPLLADANLKLQQEVLTKERVGILSTVPLFQFTDMDFLQLLAADARVLILPPNEIITYAGSITREMYIVQEGYCEIYDSHTQQIKQAGPGSHCGDVEMLIGVPSVQTVRTITHCKVINITYTVYSQAVSIFPNINNEICEVMAEKANIFENLKMEPKHKFSFCEKRREPGPHIKKRGFFNILHYIYTFFRGFSDTHANIYKHCKHSHGLEDYWAPFNELGKMSFIKYLLLPWTVNPAGNLVKLWCFFRVISAFFVGIINPYRQAVRPYGAYLGFLLGVLDIHAYADVYFNMHVGYFNKNGLLVTHPLKTAKHYITHSFAMDVLACFPFEIFVPLFETRGTIYSVQQYFDYKCNMNVVNCILCLNRVLQIYRLASAFHILETVLLTHADLICVIKFIPMTLVFINTWVSVVVTMSCYYETQEQVFGTKFTPNTMICMNGSWLMQSHFRNITHPTDVYTVAFYWATGTLVGSGFGDVTAQYRGGMVICIWMIICGTLLFGYMFSSISSSKAGLNTTLSQYQEMLAELITFMKFENVDADLQKHFINHFEHEWKRTQGVEPHVIFSNFHTALMEDAMAWMYEHTLKEVPLFEQVERSFYRVIGKHLRQNYFLRGETVIRSQDVQSNIYIIYRGKVEVLSFYNEMIACMGPGGLFGNIGSVNASICSVTIVASRNLDVLTIPSETFYSLLKNYPNIKHNIDMLLTTVKDYIMPSIIVEDGDEETLRTYSQMMGSEISQTSMKKAKHRTSDWAGSVTTMGTVSTGTILASMTGGIISGMSRLHLLLPQNWFKFAILPESSVFVIFSYIVLFAAYLDCIFISYIFAFQDHSYMPIVLTGGVESIFYIKIFLELHKAYIDRFGEYVVNSAKIRRRYLHNRYKIAVDIIANFPVEFLAVFAYGYHMKALSIMRLLHLVRIVYIYEFYKARSNILMVNKLSLQMSSLVIWVTLLIHSMACIWFYMACPLGEVTPNSWVDNAGVDTSEPFRSYTTSIYYITGLFTTTGYGDILPYTIPEVLVATMMMVISKFSVALFIGDITAVLNSYTSTLTNYEYGIAKLRDMLKNQNLSNHQMEKMWNYVRRLWKRERGKQMPRLALQAPFVLRCDLMNATYGHHLRHSYVFANTNEDFIRQLTVLLRHFVFFPGNYIVQHGDTDMRMYFIHCGEVDVLTVHPNLTETIHDVLKPNDMFGVAQGLYHGLPHHFSFRAKTVVDIVTLELDLWEHLLKYFPEAKEKIYQRASNIYINV